MLSQIIMLNTIACPQMRAYIEFVSNQYNVDDIFIQPSLLSA